MFQYNKKSALFRYDKQSTLFRCNMQSALFRCNKKWLSLLLAALFFPAAMSVQASAAPLICGADQYVLLSTGDCYAQIYDCSGNMVGNCRAAIEDYIGTAVVPKDSLVLFTNDKTWTVYSMALLENILELPLTEYEITCSHHACIVVDKKAGSYCVYDSNSRLLYQSPEIHGLNFEGIYGRIYDLESGFLAGICGYSGDGSVLPCAPALISRETGDIREITDPLLSQAFFEGRMSPFGSFFSVYDWDNGTCSLYDMDGNTALENVDSLIYPHVQMPYSLNYYSQPTLALVRTGGTSQLYDTDLLLTASFPSSETDYPAYAGGYISGMRYEELGDQICTEFALYKNKTWYPAARTEEGLLISKDGRQLMLPLNTEEYLSGFNDWCYIVAGDDSYGNGGHYEKLMDLETGSVLLESHWTDTSNTYFELFEDYCLATEYLTQGEEHTRSGTVYGPGAAPAYQSGSSIIRTWENGCIYLKRGIYHGIADVHGNWLIRTIRSPEV